MTELAVQTKPFDLSPQTFDQALTFSNYLADSDLVPKDFKGKPGNCLIAMQWGSELGLKPLQAMQNLAIINGRPSLWGDAVLALVLASPACEYVTETIEGDTSICKAKRKGAPEQIRTFSDADAKAAGLLGKQGPWTQYKARMRQMRARAFCLRDVFADVLRGLPVAEELMDTPTEKFMGAAEVVPPAAPTLPTWPDDKFAARLPVWKESIVKGKTVDGVITFALTKGALTDDQLAAIKALPAQIVKEAEPRKPDGRTGPVVVTYAQVAEALNNAQDMFKLSDAATLINAIEDVAQQDELNAIYDQRAEALN
jgi:hypothetical protein